MSTPLTLIGLSHRSAPLHLRESLALSPEQQRAFMLGLCDCGLPEMVMLATCNRLEIYALADEAQQAMILSGLGRLCGLRAEDMRPHSYLLREAAALKHLMRVAAGADSLVLGEQQILAQVRQAVDSAREWGTVGPVLSQAFGQAIHAGKRARSSTAISRHVTSISHAAVTLAQHTVSDLRVGLVVGAGEMATLAAQALSRQGIETLYVINRSLAAAERLAQRVDAQALPWAQMPAAIQQADVVISATAAPGPVNRREALAGALAQRANRPLVLVDIALPRDVDAAAQHLPGLHYYDLDDLEHFVQRNLARREAALADVAAIIDEEAARFDEWRRGRDVAPLIMALQQHTESLAEREVAATLARLGRAGDDQQQEIARRARRMLRQELHHATLRLKRDPAYADALRNRLGLCDES